MNENQCIDTMPCWDLKEGSYTGTLAEFGEYTQKTKTGSTKQFYRLVFEVETGNPYREYRAQKRYPMNDKLLPTITKDVKRWLGKNAVENNPNLRLANLLGHKATLTVGHLQGNGYRKPYSVVKKIGPVKAAQKNVNQASQPASV